MSDVTDMGLDELRNRLLKGQEEGQASNSSYDISVTPNAEIVAGNSSSGQFLSKVEREVFA